MAEPNFQTKSNQERHALIFCLFLTVFAMRFCTERCTTLTIIEGAGLMAVRTVVVCAVGKVTGEPGQ